MAFVKRLHHSNIEHGDAIVNAANERMLGGGGVDGAIHQVAGGALLEACKRYPAKNGVRCPTGEAHMTPGFNLSARCVIHTVGPTYSNDAESQPLLEAAYRYPLRRNSLVLAHGPDHELRSIAFPAIICGAYHYPWDKSAAVAFDACAAYAGALREVHFVLFSDEITDVYLGVARGMFMPARVGAEGECEAEPLAPEAGAAAGAGVAEHTVESMFAAIKAGDWAPVLGLPGCAEALALAASRALEDGWTLLHHAAASGNEAAARLLVAFGADATLQALPEAQTPAQLASSRTHIGLASILRQAALSGKDNWRPSPLLSYNKAASSAFKEGRACVADRVLNVAYGKGVVRIAKGGQYYADSLGRVLIGWHGSYDPPSGMDGEPMC